MTMNKNLYHISFRENLEGQWNPKNPDGFGLENIDLSEPDLPRISLSTSIEKCFQAIYPNISRYFEIEKYPHLDFFVYSPVLTGHERILTPQDLTKRKMVHDAHVTEEYCILDPVKMIKVMKIRINNTNSSIGLYYHPFDDPKTLTRYLAPKEVTWKVLDTFKKSPGYTKW